MEGSSSNNSNRTIAHNTTPSGGAQLTPQSLESAASKHKNYHDTMEFQVDEEEEAIEDGDEDEDNEDPV